LNNYNNHPPSSDPDSIDPGSYIKLSRDAALTDLFAALESLAFMPAPPDHLVLLSQMVSPDLDFESTITSTIKENYYRRRTNTRYDLGTGVIMNCKGSQCPYSTECEIKQSGIPDSILVDLPCVIEVAIAKQVFSSCVSELLRSTALATDDSVYLSGVDVLNIMEVIRKEILIARLLKNVKIHGDMYFEETFYPDGSGNKVLAVNPAYNYLDKLSKSRNENIKQLAIDRSSKISQSSLADAKASFYQELKAKVKLVELEVTPPSISSGDQTLELESSPDEELEFSDGSNLRRFSDE